MGPMDAMGYLVAACSLSYMGVSKNRGTPKWMVYNGKPYQDGWFGGTTIFGNIHIFFVQFSQPWKTGHGQLRRLGALHCKVTAGGDGGDFFSGFYSLEMNSSEGNFRSFLWFFESQNSMITWCFQHFLMKFSFHCFFWEDLTWFI